MGLATMVVDRDGIPVQGPAAPSYLDDGRAELPNKFN